MFPSGSDSYLFSHIWVQTFIDGVCRTIQTTSISKQIPSRGAQFALHLAEMMVESEHFPQDALGQREGDPEQEDAEPVAIYI